MYLLPHTGGAVGGCFICTSFACVDFYTLTTVFRVGNLSAAALTWLLSALLPALLVASFCLSIVWGLGQHPFPSDVHRHIDVISLDVFMLYNILSFRNIVFISPKCFRAVALA